MSESIEESARCQECGQLMTLEMTGGPGVASYAKPEGTAAVSNAYEFVCSNEDCPRFGLPNDPPIDPSADPAFS